MLNISHCEKKWRKQRFLVRQVIEEEPLGERSLRWPRLKRKSYDKNDIMGGKIGTQTGGRCRGQGQMTRFVYGCMVLKAVTKK